MTQEILRPNGIGSSTNLVPVGDSPNWACVDDITPDEGTTHVSRTISGFAIDTYQMANPLLTHAGDTINWVRVYIRVMIDARGGDAQIVLRSGGTNYPIDIAPTTSYVDYYYEWANNPADSQPWERADLQLLECGVALSGGPSTREGRCTQVWAVVDFDSNVIAGRTIVDNYRSEHYSIIHGQQPPLDHTACILAMSSELVGLGYAGINNFFVDNYDFNAQEIGYVDFAAYYSDCYDANGDIISGKESVVSSFNGKWH